MGRDKLPVTLNEVTASQTFLGASVGNDVVLISGSVDGFSVLNFTKISEVDSAEAFGQGGSAKRSRGGPDI